ncbi:hypothetical protein [Bacillus horti]|uniref:Uncharacterized protein n=2 Tax=Caldalkalibacillus horti TaxID=77523 RepID=A0ABT9VWU2_9BACI|nr:hypothetical protein [Bacillus horti]
MFPLGGWGLSGVIFHSIGGRFSLVPVRFIAEALGAKDQMIERGQ